MATWKTWRRTERERLLAHRATYAVADREAAAVAIGTRLDAILPFRPGGVIGIYWPIKSEIDLRPWALAAAERHGMSIGLPVVETEKAPLVYRRWTRDSKMEKGVWNILVPAERDVVIPDLVFAPVVGFDPVGLYRLGYGGAYFDRTLAALKPKPLAIGIAFDSLALAPGFERQSHDIPMDLIVTPARVLRKT